MTCKDCISFGPCSRTDGTTTFYGKECACGNVEKLCQYFKDKSLYIKLPCKLGQIVYDVVLCDDDIYRIFKMKISEIKPFGSLYESTNRPAFLWNVFLTDDYIYAFRTFSDIGTKIFFSKEKAEERLKELNENA